MWIEKYRPFKLKDVADQPEVVHALQTSIQNKNLPHLLFYGPPGTGKTSAILAACRELWGPEVMRSRVLELNASDERGISVMRTKVKDFAKIMIATPPNTGGYPCPPFKIIILDEADTLTADAQSALRRTMVLRSAVRIAAGDMRRSITLLETAKTVTPEGSELSVITLEKISGLLPFSVIEDISKACSSNSFEKLELLVNSLTCSGYSVASIVDGLITWMTTTTEGMASLSDSQKAAFARYCAEVDYCMTYGANEYLQLFSLLSQLMKLMCQM